MRIITLTTLLLVLLLVSGTWLFFAFFRPRQKGKQGRRKSLEGEIFPPEEKKPGPPEKKERQKKRAPLERMDGKPLSTRQQKQNQEQVYIVGVQPEKGLWTRMILGERVDFILTRLRFGNNPNQGYWVNLVNAQKEYDNQKKRDLGK